MDTKGGNMLLRTIVVCSLILLLPLAAIGQVFTIAPQQPTIGASITLAYDPSSPGATLKGKLGLRGEAMMLGEFDMPTLVEVPLTKSGGKWTGSFVLGDDRARLLIFRVVAGKDQDNGDGNAPSVMVHGKDGKPLMGANLQRGNFMAGGGILEFKHARDFGEAKASYATEKALYPDNWKTYPAEWGVMMRENRGDETKGKIKPTLDEFYAKFKDNDEAVAAVIGWYAQTGQQEKADAIKKAAIEKNPKGAVAQNDRRGDIFRQADRAKQIELIEKYIADFPLKESERDQMVNLEINALIYAKEIDKALLLIEKKPNSNLYNAIAWEWIDKGENLEQAVQVAKRGVDAAYAPGANPKPSYMSDADWRDASNGSTAAILDTYGYGLFKLGKFADAQDALQKAYDLSKGKEPDITERLAMAYNKNGIYDKTLEIGKSAVEHGKTTEKLVEYFKQAYTKVIGSANGFDAMLVDAKSVGAKDLKAKTLESRLNKPAIPFALKGLDGTTVQLADLKGKVVVIDFWATWCGPCKMSFPGLQKVYDKYKTNPSVKIFALDTWERVAGKEREDLVKKFIAENKYTFPVLYDEGFVDKYGVDGIPTKFVIDKKGNLAFKAVGFEGEDSMIQELTGQIEILLAE
jgi:thiol-disulfide isomerase/thioredoxin